ncbi:response regulator transcription factor [Microbacterium shaanxiense]
MKSETRRTARTISTVESAVTPVANLVAQGRPKPEIAARLHLAHGTVKNTVSALLRKLGQPDRTALALHLVRDLGAKK